MKVFNINLGIGEASSGVEYAQAYRSKLLNSIDGVEPYFVFLDWMPSKSLYALGQKIGLKREQMLWFYDVLRGSRVSNRGLPKVQLECLYGKGGYYLKENEDSYRIDLNDSMYIVAYQQDCPREEFRSVDMVSNNRLLFRDYYSNDEKYATDFYRVNPITNYSVCYSRILFDEQERVVLVENLINDEESTFLFKNRTYLTKELLFKKVLRSIGVDGSSKILLDRSTGTAKALLELKKEIPFDLSVVVHADHYIPEGTDDFGVVWNNYYDYVFRNADKIDAFICSTEIQSELLRKQLPKYEGAKPTIVTIPVGFLGDKEKLTDKRDRRKWITVSRLAPEKKLDVLIKAFKQAIDVGVEEGTTLDIYGSGIEKSRLKNLIKQLGLETVVTLKGHCDMENVYTGYNAYVSASATEGFGLSLMEAIGAGLFMVGFNVPYGNPTFMDTRGGFLVEGHPDDEDAVDKLSQGILALSQIKNEEVARKDQYQKAKEFTFTEVRGKLERFINADII